MKTYAALGEKTGQIGSFTHCVTWALRNVEAGLEPVYQIVRCRAGEPEGKVIAEAHEDGLDRLDVPTYVLISRLSYGSESFD